MSALADAMSNDRPIPALLSWSGGKDAAWTLHALKSDPRYRVAGLLTTVTEGYERIAMHGIRRDVLLAQASAVGLPLFEARLPQRADNAVYENSFVDALDAARAAIPGLCHVAFGDLFLADVKAWRDSLCARHGWTALYPLFGGNTATLAREMIDGGLKAVLCCVDTSQLDARFAGQPFDQTLLDDLPNAVDPCGENGEFHSCVFDGPMLSRALSLRRGESVLRDERFAFTDFELNADSQP